MALPLDQLRVLDLTRVLAGPLATMMLGDLGADVIKVERPPAGDETRGWGPPFDSRGESAYFLSINRNKLSIAADLAVQTDLSLIMQLMERADVVVDNFLPGALDRLGLDVDAELRRHPRLVWCTLTGFDSAPARPGYDFVVQAEAGWMSITGEPGGDPMKVGVALADVVAGKDAAIAILAAVHGRDRGGERRVVISLERSARAALVNVAQSSMVTGAEPARWGNAHANLVPYQLFRAANRHVVIAVGSDAQWIACAGALDLRDLANDPELRTNAGRVRNRESLVSAIAARVAAESAEGVLAKLKAAGVPAGLVRTVLESLADAAGASPLTGLPPAAGGAGRRPPPTLDQHGDLVRRLGWDAFRSR